MSRRTRILLGLAFAACAGMLAHAQDRDAWRREWNQPFAPLKIVGNVYYVGTNELGSYLVTTPAGHILVDSGTRESLPLIEQSIAALGFKLSDVKVLLTTQAHFDHVEAMAALKKKTGARLLASRADATLLADGGRSDYLFSATNTFEPVAVDGYLEEGTPISLGGTTLTARMTPGHTPGCTTFVMTTREDGRQYRVVFAGSLAINPGTRLMTNPSYPGIADDYAKAITTIKALDVDVFLAAHAGHFDLAKKAEAARRGATPNPFIDRGAAARYAATMDERYRAALSAEK